MSKPLERLRQLVETGDPNGTVTLAWLGQILDDGDTEHREDPQTSGDLTVEDVAAEVGRAPSTVRGWLSAGELRGYKVNRRDWRIPRAALNDWRAAQMGAAASEVEADEDVDIGEWRHTG